MGEEGESSCRVVFVDSFVDGRDELFLGADLALFTIGGGPGECHIVDNDRGMGFESSAGAGSEKKFLGFGTEKGEDVGRERCIFVLGKKNLVIDGIAREGVEEFVGETNRDSLDLIVFGGFSHSRRICFERKC